ncbi:MAG: NADH-quinone oxidoreductase subunit C [Kutzneria sp.]|nr:NADH-quinone oxidoreductase subunit C [Kutzneria sp.]MBV9843921.1 NADH-quinone oxidoreductase subunit C [Kutzneria sp.]
MIPGSTELATRTSGLVAEAVVRTAFGQSWAEVPIARWRTAAQVARDELGCLMFDWLGVEDAGRPGDVGRCHAVLLHVVDPVGRLGLLLRTEVTGEQVLPSLAEVWTGAGWHEREAAEMFGLALADEPDPARLLLSASFAGHPLRKDFVLASRVVRPWPGGFEPGESGPASGRRRLVPPGLPDPSWGPRRGETGA